MSRYAPHWPHSPSLIGVQTILALVTAGTVLLGLTSCTETTTPPVASTSAADPTGETATSAADPTGETRYTVDVLETLPTDPDAFIQGFSRMPDGHFLISTGQKGHSEIFRLYPTDTDSTTEDSVVKKFTQTLPADYFGEGSAQTGDRVWQLTWQAGKAFSYAADGLTPTGEVDYHGEGWGLCYDGHDLLMSDGTDRIILRDPDTFAQRGSLHATSQGTPITHLNELDCTGDRVYANIFLKNDIAIIDRSDGHLHGWIDASALAEREAELFTRDRATASEFRKKMWDTGNAVLNGIASDPNDPTVLYLTGKTWSHIYKVKLIAED